MSFEGKVALVTGGGSGIGRAICMELARRGSDIAILELHQGKAEETLAAVRAMGRRGEAFQCDVSDSRQVNDAVASCIDTFGQVDIVVNNAGIATQGLIVDLSDEQWDRILRVDLTGVFYVSRAVARHMIQRGAGGAVVNISSLIADRARPLNGPYCAAKAGVEAFSRVLALELAPHGIRVNCVAPGHIATPLTEPMFTPKVIDLFEKQIALGKIGQPQWIARVVAFLASEDACYVTGQVVTADGGYNINGSLHGLEFGPTGNEI